MRRGEIYVAKLPEPAGSRPVLILTRTPALSRRTQVTVAPITRTIRKIASEVPLGRRHGLRVSSVANCDSLQTIDKSHLSKRPIGQLGGSDIAALDHALRYALGIKA